MKLVVLNDQERFLELKSKTIRLPWCSKCRLFEGKCDLTDLKGENGKSLPLAVRLVISQKDEHRFPLGEQMLIQKYALKIENPILVVQYGILWQAEEHQNLRDDLYQRLVIKQDKKFLNKLRRYYYCAEVIGNSLIFGRLLGDDIDFYQAILADLEFNLKFFSIS